VQSKLDGIIEQLSLKQHLKFGLSNVKLFAMWYTRQPREVQEKVKVLVKEGRIEFVNGGWSSSDESCASFEDLLTNMMKGQAFLRSEFGVIPRVGWLTDSIDHSSGYARIQSDLGLTALIFSKLNNREIERRAVNKSLDFVWRPHSQHHGSHK